MEQTYTLHALLCHFRCPAKLWMNHRSLWLVWVVNTETFVLCWKALLAADNSAASLFAEDVAEGLSPRVSRSGGRNCSSENVLHDETNLDRLVLDSRAPGCSVQRARRLPPGWQSGRGKQQKPRVLLFILVLQSGRLPFSTKEQQRRTKSTRQLQRLPGGKGGRSGRRWGSRRLRPELSREIPLLPRRRKLLNSREAGSPAWLPEPQLVRPHDGEGALQPSPEGPRPGDPPDLLPCGVRGRLRHPGLRLSHGLQTWEGGRGTTRPPPLALRYGLVCGEMRVGV
ncbi:uncharacterized protein LOC110072237 [Pogona vitticeps]